MNDDLDTTLRSAADDLRHEIDGLPVPGFTPRRSVARPAATLAMVVLVGVGALVGVTSLRGGDGDTIRVADRPAADVSEPRRITDVGEGEIITPGSMGTHSFNADGTRAMLYSVADDRYLVIDTSSFEGAGDVLFELDIDPDNDTAFSWHPDDPDLVYWTDVSSADLIETDVTTGRDRVAASFDECDSINHASGFGSTANGTAHLGLVCVRDGDFHSLAFDLVDEVTTIAEEPSNSAFPPVSASPDGSVFVVVDLNEIIVLDATLSPTSLGSIPIRAAASSVDPDAGRIVVTSFDSDDPGLAIAFDVRTGERTDLVSGRTGDGFPPNGIRMSAGGSMIVTSARDDGRDTGDGELWLIDPSSGSVTTLGEHAMVFDDENGVWKESHVALSPDGSLLLYSSNDGAGGVDTWVLQLP